MRRRLVHHLQAAGNDAGGDDAGDRVAGLLHIVEIGEDHLPSSGFGVSLTVTSVITASSPLRTVDQRQQVEPGRVERIGAEFDRPARDREATHLSTLGTVRLYFRQCTPLEFSATLPPMVQAICDDGPARSRGHTVAPPPGDGEVADARLDDGGARQRVESGCA